MRQSVWHVGALRAYLPFEMKFRPLFILPLLLVVTLTLSGCQMIGPLINALLPFAGIKLLLACMPEHVRVDTPSGPKRVENLTAGDVVIGYSGKPVRVLQKHTYLESPSTEFLILTFSDGAVVEVCGMHRVAGVRAQDIRVGDEVDGRVLAGVTRHSGEKRSCDLLTEDLGYQINGVPVNSMIEEMHRAAADSRLRDPSAPGQSVARALPRLKVPVGR